MQITGAKIYYLQFAVFCHNITPMESLNWLSPHFLMFVQEPNVPVDKKLNIPQQETYAKRENQLSKLKKIRDKVPKFLERAAGKMKASYDKNRVTNIQSWR